VGPVIHRPRKAGDSPASLYLSFGFGLLDHVDDPVGFRVDDDDVIIDHDVPVASELRDDGHDVLRQGAVFNARARRLTPTRTLSTCNCVRLTFGAADTSVERLRAAGNGSF
jgi:hypothetical protein